MILRYSGLLFTITCMIVILNLMFNFGNGELTKVNAESDRTVNFKSETDADSLTPSNKKNKFQGNQIDVTSEIIQILNFKKVLNRPNKEEQNEKDDHNHNENNEYKLKIDSKDEKSNIKVKEDLKLERENLGTSLIEKNLLELDIKFNSNSREIEKSIISSKILKIHNNRKINERTKQSKLPTNALNLKALKRANDESSQMSKDELPGSKMKSEKGERKREHKIIQTKLKKIKKYESGGPKADSDTDTHTSKDGDDPNSVLQLLLSLYNYKSVCQRISKGNLGNSIVKKYDSLGSQNFNRDSSVSQEITSKPIIFNDLLKVNFGEKVNEEKFIKNQVIEDQKDNYKSKMSEGFNKIQNKYVSDKYDMGEIQVTYDYDVESSVPHLPDCSKRLKRFPILVVSTLDGQISGLSYQTGEVLWSHETSADGDPLLSSSLSKLEVSSRGEWVRLIPSLDGGIYRFDGKNVEALPITADTLLHSSFKFNEDTIFSGGKFNEILGIEPQTGEIKYVCNSSGCPRKQATGSNDHVLVVKRISQAVRAIDPKTGSERWNFNVGKHEVNVANGGCESSFENDDAKSSLLSLHMVLPEGLITAMDERSQVIWRQKLSSPIVSAWSLINGQLDKIDMFSGNSIPALLPEDSTDEPDGKGSSQEGSSRDRQPALYVGVHQQQLYIQQNGNLKETNSALQRFIAPRSVEKSKDGVRKIHWKPSLAIPISRALVVHQGPNDHFFVDYETELSVIGDLVIGNLDHPYDHGYYLFEEDEDAFLDGINYWNITEDEDWDEGGSSLADHIYYLCFEVGPSFWWKMAAVFGLYGILHVLFVQYLISKVVSDLRKRMSERVRALTVTILHNIFTEHPQVLAIIQRMGVGALPLSPLPFLGEIGEIHPLVDGPQRQDSTFSSRYGSDFEPVRCLGTGGFGVVVQVKNKLDENEYAIKRIVLPSKESSAERVKREVRALAKLNHSNIVRYYNSWLETPPIGWEHEADSWWRNSDALSLSVLTPYSEQLQTQEQPSIAPDFPSKGTHSLSGVVNRLNPHLEPNKPSPEWNCDRSSGDDNENDDSLRQGEWSEGKVPGDETFGDDPREDHDSTDDDDDDDSDGEGVVVVVHDDDDRFLGVDNSKMEDSFEVCFEDSVAGRELGELSGNDEGRNYPSRLTSNNELPRIVTSEIITRNDFSRLTCTTRSSLRGDSEGFENSFVIEKEKRERRSKSSSFSVSSTRKKFKLCARRRVKSHSSCQDQQRRPSTLNLAGSNGGSVSRSKGIEKLVTNLLATPNPRTYLYIQMELCQKESLKDWLFANLSRDTHRLYSMFNDIVHAVEYVHDRSLMHRDLKPSNIFFSLDGEIKIGDFGLVTTIDNDHDARTPVSDDTLSGSVDTSPTLPQLQQRTLNAGTHLYMSPEQMCGHTYTYKVDIFSLGLIFFEMLVPFSTEMERRQVMLKARDNIFPPEFTTTYPDVANLLHLTLHRNPNERPTTRGIRVRQPLVSFQKDLESISPEEHFHLTRIRGHARSHSGSSWSFCTSVSSS